MSIQPVESLTDMPVAMAVFTCTLGVRIKAPFLRNRGGAWERCLKDSLWSFSRSWSPEPGGGRASPASYSTSHSMTTHCPICEVPPLVKEDTGLKESSSEMAKIVIIGSLSQPTKASPGITQILSLRGRQWVYFFSVLCVEILMFHEISRCGIWDTFWINIIWHYDFQLH